MTETARGTTPATGTAPGTSADGAASGARLACVDVTVRFGGIVAVNDVSLAVPPATIVGLVGPNGAGKTTLFGVLSGLLRPSRGRVLLNGIDVTDARPQLRADAGLSRTFQHPEIFTGLTVRDHLVLAHRAKHARSRVWSDLVTMGSLRPPEESERSAVDELVNLLGLQAVADGPALGLPLGVARLLELGRALAATPTVLLLDEPSSGLDSGETEQFEHTLRTVAAERGLSVLLVEHDVELVMRLCSSISVLDFGTLIASGTPAEIRANPAVRAAYLGEEIDQAAPSGPAQPATAATSSAAAPAQPTAGPSSTAVSAASAAGGQPILTVRDLCVRYGDAVALSDVSFELPAGTALAVLGANGAGKSSLARGLCGLVPPAKGSVTFAREDITRWPPHRIRRAGLLYLPEGRGVFRELSVTENLRMAAATLTSRQARREGIERALQIFPPLAERRNQTARLLSGGEQQMLSLARGLVLSPRVLIADEMSLGLAPKLVDLVFESLARARQAGVTVVMIEQYVHRALAFADHCLLLQRGELAWSGPAQAAQGEVLATYLGEALAAS